MSVATRGEVKFRATGTGGAVSKEGRYHQAAARGNGEPSARSHPFADQAFKATHPSMLSLLFPRHLGRLAFLTRLIPLEMIVCFGIGNLGTFGNWNTDRLIELAMVVLLIIYGVAFAFLPRVRDCAMPGWTLIFAFIPFASSLYGLILMFGPSRVLPRRGTRTPDPDDTPPVIPGGWCAACGKSLITAAEGVIPSDRRILCHDCHE